MTEGIAYARAGLLGNPSDGYHGKIIAVSVRNFRARVTLEESERLVIEPASQDRDEFRDPADFLGRVALYGYYGGTRLIKAALREFLDYFRAEGRALPRRNFTARYESDIPRQVGLAGSSAIVMAALRALLNFYEVEIPLETLPTLALGAERDELDITAGFMDRVVQAYEGCIYMDLQERYIQETGHGRYERMDASLLPPLYLAYKPSLGKVSGRVLSEIRIRYDQGDTRVRETLARIAGLAEKGREALERRNTAELKILMDENFDLRRTIMTISPANLEMIAAARACGASAKFAGSGGSLIGVYDGEGMFDRLCAGLTPLGVIVVKPEIY